MKRALSLVPAVASVLLAGALYFSAFDSSSLPEHPTAGEVNSFVMSPFCPGLTLEECPSAQAGELRSEVSQRLASGSSGPELENWLVTTYGEGVLGRPRRAGIFILPAMLLAVGISIVAWTLRPRRVNTSDEPDARASSWESERVNKEIEAFAGGTE